MRPAFFGAAADDLEPQETVGVSCSVNDIEQLTPA